MAFTHSRVEGSFVRPVMWQSPLPLKTLVFVCNEDAME